MKHIYLKPLFFLILLSSLFCVNCGDDDLEETIENAFVDYFANNWNIESIEKCEGTVVTEFYQNFSIDFSYNGTDDNGNYVFIFETSNGLYAFPDSGSVVFPSATDFSSESITGVRNDEVQVIVNGLPGTIDEFRTDDELDFETDNADCSIEDGRVNQRPRYIYKAKTTR